MKRRLSERPLAWDGRPLHLALANGDHFGWGVCGRALRREISRLVPTLTVRPEDARPGFVLPGKILHTLTDAYFSPLVDVRGEQEYGYTFFECRLPPEAPERARRFERVLAGSSWCRDRLVEVGVSHVDVLLQGVDPEVFHPRPPRPEDGRYVVFSGGKFEPRKSQDLVIRAVAALQQKHPDVHLIHAWFNPWPESAALMQASPYIRCDFRGQTWEEIAGNLLRDNGADPARCHGLGLASNREMAEWYAASDLGVFPNRCEGGTNLVLMEYLASGRPVVALDAHGHRDVLNRRWAWLLPSVRQVEIRQADQAAAVWDEPSLDELIAALEHAYRHRDAGIELGRQAGQAMKRFAWAASARRAVDILFHPARPPGG